ncbi:MAG: DNA mismatch repair endonuclease MutL [Alloprevotella sp.]|nr:DNA mismatch repair endonuclease MutL [Alloprevotella sp.]
MSDVIHLLPDSVANQIAAGEVIQRPASVVKELVENAIDAKADRIQVWIEDAGKSLIQVIDNGCGMSETDARLAFERHATSKIRQATDLFALTTMGFRGEALPSICAVAQVELRTRQRNDELGTMLRFEGSRLLEQEPVSCPVGANFQVRNLFFNIPARRRFLKSDTTELANIVQEFERVALANPAVQFELYSERTVMLKLERGNFRQRVASLFGAKLNEKLVPVEVDTDMVRISGLVGIPDSARKRNVRQFFLVNHRYMRHPYFAKAVMAAFDRLLPEGEQVPFFLNFEVDPARIDVNIHPSKAEIKFQDEPHIWQILLAAVRETLSAHNAMPSIDFNTTDRPDIPLFNPDGNPPLPTVTLSDHYSPFKATGDHTAPVKSSSHTTQPWEAPTRLSQAEPHTEFFTPEQVTLSPSPVSQESSTDYLQIQGRYIVTYVESGLLLIDQHRAHIRVLYDLFCKRLQQGDRLSQRLLFPCKVELSTLETLCLNSLSAKLNQMGFDISPADEANLFEVCAIPPEMSGLDIIELIHELLANWQSDENAQSVTAPIHQLALTLARRGAIPEGQYLTAQEMNTLMQQLFAGTQPNFTPDGQPIVAILSNENIASLF